MMKKILATILFLATLPLVAFAQDASIRGLEQFVSTSTPQSSITQRIWGTPLKITGITASLPICISSSGLATTTGCSSGTFSYDAWTHPAYGGSATTSLLTLSGGFLSTASSTFTSGFNFTLATGTSATTTNFFATTASSSNLFAGNLKLGNGSASSPSLSFSNDSGFNTGIYLAAENILSFSAAGTAISFSSTGPALRPNTDLAVNLGTSAQRWGDVVALSASTTNLMATGSTTLQAFTFTSATGTSATTTNMFATTASSTNLFSSIGNIAALTVGNGTVSAPGLVVGTGAAQGLYRVGSGSLGITNGTNGLTWNGSSFFPNTDDLRSLGLSSNRWLEFWGDRATTTSATSTSFFSTTASSTSLFSTNATTTTLYTLKGFATSMYVNSGGLLVSGSTTLQNFTFVNATGTSATTTNLFSTTASTTKMSVGSTLGVGSSTPFTSVALGVGKTISVTAKVIATSTSMTVSWLDGNHQTVRIGTSATAIAFSNYVPGQTLLLEVCNPTSTGGAVTFTGVFWPGGTAPTTTTTANKCDLVTFRAGNGTSTPIVYGGYNQNY